MQMYTGFHKGEIGSPSFNSKKSVIRKIFLHRPNDAVIFVDFNFLGECLSLDLLFVADKYGISMAI